MKRRSKLFLASALTVTSIAAACTFPDVGFRTDTSENDSGQVDSGNTDDTGSPVADAGATTLDSGNVVDAEPLSEGGVITEAECNVPDSGHPHCDCDEDGWQREGCDAGANTDLKQWDCDDYNRDHHPGAGPKADPLPDGGWDWNCNKTVEKGYLDGYACPSKLCTSANARKGFVDNVACGQSAALHSCSVTCGGLGGVLGQCTCTDSLDNASVIQPCN